jgi:hypothetical protein
MDQRPQPAPGTRYGVPFHDDRTLDGEVVRVGGVYHCRAQLHPPEVRVRVTGQVRTEPSWLDGALVVLWEAEAEDAIDGHRVVVEPWMLSVAPVGEVLRRLRGGGATAAG